MRPICRFFSHEGQKDLPRQEKATSTLRRHSPHHDERRLPGYFAVEYEKQGDGVVGSKKIMEEVLAALQPTTDVPFR